MAAYTAADASSLRQNVRILAADQLSESEQAKGRVEVLPVQWRKNLNLDVRLYSSIGFAFNIIHSAWSRPLRKFCCWDDVTQTGKIDSHGKHTS